MSNYSQFGCHHTACGRVLKNRHTAAVDLDRGPSPAIDPVSDVVQGARSYAQAKGLTDPHDGSIDYHKVQTHKGLITDLGHEYDKLPLNDPRAHRHFQAMRDEVNDQYHHMTQRMGINVHVTDHDPYKNVHELRNDVANNHRIQVLGTHATGHHPFFSDEDNDKFRAVHDVFGHLGTGRDFDRHGEEAAFQAHSRMFSHHALPAMASETRGQNGSLITNGHFGPQRIALLPHRLWHPGLAHFGSMQSEDIDEYRRQRWAQDDRAERASGGYRTEQKAFFGDANAPKGDTSEKSLTFKDFLKGRKQPGFDDQPLEDRENWHGFEMGHRHLSDPNPSDVHEMRDRAINSPSREHFLRGYLEGRGRHVASASEAPEEERPFSRESNVQRVAELVAVKDRWLLDDMPLGLQVEAHVSGNQIDILHCPFCGSGSVIGRSDGTVECGYCTSVFTVQVQPSYNGFPQSVDGQPYNWPGQPQQGDPGVAAPNVPPGTDMAPGEEPPMGDEDALAGGADPNPQNTPFGAPSESSDPAAAGDDDDDDDDNPFAKKDDKGSDDKKDSKSDKKKGDNPFAKKKSYRTAAGAELDPDDFIAHLAIKYAKNPQRVAERVKAARARGEL